MEHICAPWRSEYFGKKEQGCVFCNVVNHPEKDAQTGVLFRAKRCFGIMNLYPYTPGHFMVIPYAHADNIENLEEQTWSEMSAYVREGVKILKRELNAAGQSRRCGYRRARTLSSRAALERRYEFYHFHRRGARKRRALYSALREAKSRVCGRLL